MAATTRATPAAERFLRDTRASPSPPLHFFAGKGGVGKTTCAAAAAVAVAATGARVLIVSTDPAHSLRDALGGSRAGQRRAQATASRVSLGRARGTLHAVELDADAALTRWIGERREALRRIVGRGTYLDDDDIDALLRLAFPGVDELIGLIELTRVARSGPWDRVVVDTAPTGHTLRLLAMPATLSRIAVVLDDMQAKHRFLAQSLGGRHRADAADALVDEVAAAGRDLEALLRDPARVRVSWVLLPEALSLAEARDGIAALEVSGIAVGEIVVNRVTPVPPGPCALCEGRRVAEAEVLRAVRTELKGRALRAVPALEREPRGIPALRAIAAQTADADARPARVRTRTVSAPAPDDARWLAAIAPPERELILFAGKGGVGKTTCAAAVALALAPERRVLLLSTDPAHSLGDALDTELGNEACAVPGAPASLRAREIDAPALFAARRRRYLETVDAVFDALRGGSAFDSTYDRIVVEDLIDLAPPGLDELLGILAVTEALGIDGAVPNIRTAPATPRSQATDGARMHATREGLNAMRGARYDVAVVDTAPTGHALRLLAMPEAALEWVHAFMTILLKYRALMGLGELGQELVAIARELRGLRALLTDPRRAAVVAVTRPAEVPRLETRRLLGALRALHVGVAAVVVNARTPPGCARCRRVAAAEARVLAAIRRDVASQAPRGCAIIQAPAVAPPPRGVAALTAWRRTWTPGNR